MTKGDTSDWFVEYLDTMALLTAFSLFYKPTDNHSVAIELVGN